MPDWYGLVRAAAYLHVPPWDLGEQPVAWRNWALAAAVAEADVENERMAALLGGRK